MSDWGYENSNDAGQAGTNENTGPKALRDAYEALKKQNEELKDGLATIQKDLQKQKIQGTLSELGIPETAAEQYKGEADPAKVREWATTMQSIFGGSAGTSATPTTSVPTPGLEADAAAQLQRMNEAGQSGTPLGNAEAAMGRIADANDLQGLLSAWKQMG